VDELELQSAYAQRAVDELDGVVRTCGDELAELRREVESLRNMIKGLVEGDDETGEDEAPA
jgi:uncharacterized coiled-coil protein SlyX